MREITCDLIVADKPTINGRVYPKGVLEEFVRQCNSGKEMFVTDSFDGGSMLSLERTVGLANAFVLTEEGTIRASIELLPHSPIPENLLNMCDFSPMVMAERVERDGDTETIVEARVVYWALTPKPR